MNQKTYHGYVNAAAFNRDPSGDVLYFETRAKRNAALAKFRAYAIGKGLSESASQSGIYPVKLTVRGTDALQRFVKRYVAGKACQ